MQDTSTMSDTRPTSRRAFLTNGTLILSATAALPSTLLAVDEGDWLSVGLVTDLHYADKPASGSRHYRETLEKLAKAADQFSQKKPDLIVELGDLIDAADAVETELGYLKRINKDFSAICPNRHYVLGNHCVSTLTKHEFLDCVQRDDSYYSFDAGEFHFIVLDSCFRSDGEPYGRNNFQWTDANIPKHEIEWLKADLDRTSRKTIVLAHQRLDVSNHYGVKNAAEVRRLLENSQKVLAVLQGHSHKNDYNHFDGIHYCTLVAMVEGSGADNNAFSLMQVDRDGTIRIEGFIKQKDYQWRA
jgi:alkaline phosphatase